MIAPFDDESLEFKIRPEGEALEPNGDTTGEIHARADAESSPLGLPFENQISIIADGKSESRVESFFVFPEGGIRTLYFLMRAEYVKKDESDWLAELDAAFDEARVFTPETIPPQLPARFGKPALPINDQSCIKVDQSMCPNEEK